MERALLPVLEENRPAIRRFLESANEFYEGFPVTLALASVTFARGGWSEVPLGRMDLSELTDLVERLWEDRLAAQRRALPNSLYSTTERPQYDVYTSPRVTVSYKRALSAPVIREGLRWI